MVVVSDGKKTDLLAILRSFEKKCTCDNCEAVLTVTCTDLEFYVPEGDTKCLVRVVCCQCENVMILHDPRSNPNDFDALPDERIERLTALAFTFKGVMPKIMEQVANARIPNQHDNDGLGAGQMDACYGGNGK